MPTDIKRLLSKDFWDLSDDAKFELAEHFHKAHGIAVNRAATEDSMPTPVDIEELAKVAAVQANYVDLKLFGKLPVVVVEGSKWDAIVRFARETEGVKRELALLKGFRKVDLDKIDQFWRQIQDLRSQLTTIRDTAWKAGRDAAEGVASEMGMFGVAAAIAALQPPQQQEGSDGSM